MSHALRNIPFVPISHYDQDKVPSALYHDHFSDVPAFGSHEEVSNDTAPGGYLDVTSGVDVRAVLLAAVLFLQHH